MIVVIIYASCGLVESVSQSLFDAIKMKMRVLANTKHEARESKAAE